MHGIDGDLIKILFLVGGAIAMWLNNRSKEKTGDADAGESPRPLISPEHAEDVEAAERTRRIQEEIRRKINERGAATGGAQPSAPSPELRPSASVEGPVLKPRETHTPPPIDSAILERQRALAEQLRELEARRAERKQQAAAVAAVDSGMSTPAQRLALVSAKSVQSELRDPAALRKAWVMREVLGTPVGLR